MNTADQKRFDKLRAEYSELLADYSHLKNSEHVLTAMNARIVFNISTMQEEDAVKLFSQIEKLIAEHKVPFTFEVADGKALYKTTGTPNE